MLNGYIPIWATDVNGCNPEAADSTVDNETPDNADDNPAPADASVDVTCAPNDDTAAVACDSNDDTHPANPAKLNGGVLNCVNVAATDVDVV